MCDSDVRLEYATRIRDSDTRLGYATRQTASLLVPAERGRAAGGGRSDSDKCGRARLGSGCLLMDSDMRLGYAMCVCSRERAGAGVLACSGTHVGGSAAPAPGHRGRARLGYGRLRDSDAWARARAPRAAAAAGLWVTRMTRTLTRDQAHPVSWRAPRRRKL